MYFDTLEAGGFDDVSFENSDDFFSAGGTNIPPLSEICDTCKT